MKTLKATYTIDNTANVAGVQKTFQQKGVLYYSEGEICIIQEQVPGVPEKQVLYSNGNCYRYFPLAHYGHRVIPKSYASNRTDFGKYWWPLLTYFEGDKILRKALAKHVLQDNGNVRLFKGDQAAELRLRPKNSLLEYWGPATDLHLIVDKATRRLHKMERTHYRFPRRSDDTTPRVYSTSVTEIATITSISNRPIPCSLHYAETMLNHNSPARTATVTLDSIAVNEPLPEDAFAPIWPADTILLDVEILSPSDYDGTSGNLADLVMLADYYFGTLDRQAGLAWLAQYEAAVGSNPSPSQLAHLCRLHALAQQQSEAEQLYDAALSRARTIVANAAPGGEAAAEFELARYLAEFAFYRSKGRVGGSHASAASYLEGQLGSLVTPMARAFVAGRAADHYAMGGDIPRGEAVLDAVAPSLLGDAGATRWLDAWRARLAIKRSMNESRAARRKKRQRIGFLRDEVLRLRAAGNNVDVTRFEQELLTLTTEP